MKKWLCYPAVLLLGTGMVTTVQASFVVKKITAAEKPSQIKAGIVEQLESLLTSSSDLIASIAQQQHQIVQKVRDITQGTGLFLQASPQALKRYRDSLQVMNHEVAAHAKRFDRLFLEFNKDFSERS